MRLGTSGVYRVWAVGASGLGGYRGWGVGFGSAGVQGILGFRL